MLLRDEIFEQPDALRRVLSRNAGVADRARELLTADGIAHVVIAARGTSDNAARYAKYVWGTELRIPVTLAAPSIFTRYDAPPRLAGAVVVAISQSGQSPDLLAVLAEARRQERPTIAIVNDAESPLADLADLAVPLNAGTEGSVAATKSYTTSLLTVAMIASGGSTAQSLSEAPDRVDEVLALEPAIVAEVDRVGPIDRAVVLGRGYNHSTAFEWALKLQEMAYVFAHGFSTADFAHGPFAVLEPGFPVLAVLADGPTAGDGIEIVRRARDEAGAVVSAITNLADTGLDGVVTPAVPEQMSPITLITCAQLFTLHMAVARGIDPEQPRGLHKVTRTS